MPSWKDSCVNVIPSNIDTILRGIYEDRSKISRPRCISVRYIVVIVLNVRVINIKSRKTEDVLTITLISSGK